MAEPLNDDLTRRFFDILHGDARFRIGCDATHEYVDLAVRLAAEVAKALGPPTLMNVYGTPEDLAATVAESLRHQRLMVLPPRSCPSEAGVADQLQGCELEAGHTGLHRYLGFPDLSTEA